MKKLNIALFGFGVVGEGLYKTLSQKPEYKAEITKVVIKHPEKLRDAPDALFCENKKEVLDDPSIDVIIELIDDADAALDIATQAMRNGISVISANKKMIAEHKLQLIKLSKEKNVTFLYEAAVCGSVPIIRSLEEYFDYDALKSVRGIVNGSTNFILSKMDNERCKYEDALRLAQEKGFAERDPTMDVAGIDAAHKLSIITLHAFGKSVKHNKIIRKGIQSLVPFDFNYAREKQKTIKLIANASCHKSGVLSRLTVLPTFVSKSGILAQANNEYNGVLIENATENEQYLYGKGAGRYPTTSAVLSDISAYRQGYKYGYKKGQEAVAINFESSGKFYVSIANEVDFDKRIFETIEQQFNNADRSYFIGTIAYQNLVDSGILEDKAISLIAIEVDCMPITS